MKQSRSNSEQCLIFTTASSNIWDTEGSTDGDKNPSICQLVTITEFLLTEISKNDYIYRLVSN